MREKGRWAQAEVVHGFQWTRAVRGITRRANVKLCLASIVAIITRPYRMHSMDAAYCYRRSRVVPQSVCVLVTTMSPAKRLNRSSRRFNQGRLTWLHGTMQLGA